MKKIKSLTLLIAAILLTACAHNKSATFSSFINSVPSTDVASSSFNSEISSDVISSSQPISSFSSSASETSLPPIQEDYYDGYYADLVSWDNGEDLKNQLNAIIRKGYQPLSYTRSNNQNYETNIHADHTKYDFEYLDVVYSDEPTFKSATNKGWQREHAWCASLMCGSTTGNAINYKGRATDFHNLFAANASGNQSRGNKNYGYANAISETYETRFMVDNGKDGYSYDEFIFEPGDKDKGRLARAIFYMATMYKDDEVDTANNINMKGLTIVEEPVSYVPGNDCAFAIGNLTDLLEWNYLCPVDYLEMQHNISVYQDKNNPDGFAQGNRNPYVDYPELVEYVYGYSKDKPGRLADLTPAGQSFELEKGKTISHYAIKQAKREFGYSEKLTTNNYQICRVNYDFSSEDVTSTNIVNSLENHTFTESDGDFIEATITTGVNEIKYQIILNPMGVCNSGILDISTDGINKSAPDVDQEISLGGVPFLFKYSTTYNGAMTITNNPSDGGGIVVGSNPRPLTKLTLTTKNSYTFDSAFIKAKAGNASSSYSLSIQTNGTTVASGTINDSNTWKVYGAVFSTIYTGQITFVFTGSSSLKINSIAFNTIIA